MLNTLGSHPGQSEVSLCVLEFVVFFSGQAFHLKILQIG